MAFPFEHCITAHKWHDEFPFWDILFKESKSFLHSSIEPRNLGDIFSLLYLDCHYFLSSKNCSSLWKWNDILHRTSLVTILFLRNMWTSVRIFNKVPGYKIVHISKYGNKMPCPEHWIMLIACTALEYNQFLFFKLFMYLYITILLILTYLLTLAVKQIIKCNNALHKQTKIE